MGLQNTKAQLKKQVQVSPNAMQGSFKLFYPRIPGPQSRVTAQLLDSRGNALDVNVEITFSPDGTLDLSVKHQDSGIYYLRIFDGETFVMKKIILQ